MIGKYIPDSSQKYMAYSYDSLFMPTAGFNSVITFTKFGVFLRFDDSIGNLHENRF